VSGDDTKRIEMGAQDPEKDLKGGFKKINDSNSAEINSLLSGIREQAINE